MPKDIFTFRCQLISVQCTFTAQKQCNAWLDKPARLTIVPDCVTICQIRYKKKEIVRRWHCLCIIWSKFVSCINMSSLSSSIAPTVDIFPFQTNCELGIELGLIVICQIFSRNFVLPFYYLFPCTHLQLKIYVDKNVHLSGPVIWIAKFIWVEGNMKSWSAWHLIFLLLKGLRSDLFKVCF